MGAMSRLAESDTSGTRFRVLLPLRQTVRLKRNGRRAKTAA